MGGKRVKEGREVIGDERGTEGGGRDKEGQIENRLEEREQEEGDGERVGGECSL